MGAQGLKSGLVLLGLLLLAACQPAAIANPSPTPTSPSPTITSEPPATPLPVEAAMSDIPETILTATTYQQPDGNRYATGSSNLTPVTPLNIKLPDEPRWLLALAPDSQTVIWGVVLANGRTLAYETRAGTVSPRSISPHVIDPSSPPRLELAGDRLRLLLPLEERPFTPTDPLPDALPVTDGAGNWLWLSQPTERYAHGVLGDAIEAAGVSLVAAADATTLFALPDLRVIEGIAPIWADLNADGDREILVTESDAQGGGQLMVYSSDGSLLASSEAIGRGNRWRHQLAVAPFGPNGELEFTSVMTPHLAGQLQYYRLSGSTLERVAAHSGVTSHQLGSRNLDMGLAADINGDGQVEMLLPTQDYRTLVAVQRIGDGTAEVWAYPLSARLATNLAAATLPDERLAIGLGLEDGSLLIWMPNP